MENRTINHTLALVLVLCSAPTLWGYAAYAHWLATPSDMRSVSSLPDLWTSPETWYTDGMLGGEASPFFAWSHCCQRTGVSYVTVGGLRVAMYPNAPTQYEEDSPVRCPGVIMSYIYNNKLLLANKDPLMETTAKGFRLHNLEDQTVHFTYFLGGTVNNWLIQHQEKEGWAECVVYVRNGGHWNFYGDPETPGTANVQAHAGIMNLTQKVFRKMNASVDKTPAVSGKREALPVQDASTIQGLIASQHEDLATNVLHHTRDDYRYYTMEADNIHNHWHEADDPDHDDVMTKWQAAVDAAYAALASWPPALPDDY
jgi:hypothetical protein